MWAKSIKSGEMFVVGMVYVGMHPYDHSSQLKMLNHLVYVSVPNIFNNIVVASFAHIFFTQDNSNSKVSQILGNVCGGECEYASMWHHPPLLEVLNHLVGPRGASLPIVKQAPCRALLRSDLAWSGKRCDTYSYVISTHSRNSSRRNRRLWYGST